MHAPADRVGGSIPAWAGKPPRWRAVAASSAVYPRVGGETRDCTGRRSLPAGLSPRGRGNQLSSWHRVATTGSIPAWAGKPAGIRRCRWHPGVYPRVGGETSLRQFGPRADRGLSPRGRGNRTRPIGCDDLYGSIPAWAGKPNEKSAISHVLGVYPRVGGETVVVTVLVAGFVGLSPRGRGNPGHHGQPGALAGSIPAWAGKPRQRTRSPARHWVYPRVGGETAFGTSKLYACTGLSPRGRGNPESE